MSESTFPQIGSPADGISRALFGQTRRNVLALLYGRPDESFYLRQIVRMTGGGRGAVQRELEQLTGAGLLERRAQGREVYFKANAQAPVFDELRSLMAKTAGVADVLRAALMDFVDEKLIVTAFLYGSVASGKHRAESDIDLMIVGTVKLSDLLRRLREAQDRLGRDINPTIYPEAEFRQRLRKGQHFLTSVLARPKIMLVGDENDLAKLAGKRLAGDS